MKLKNISILLLLCGAMFTACNDGYEHYDGAYVSGTLTNNPMLSLTVDNNFPKEIDLTVASSELVGQDVVVEMSTGDDLITQYNKKYKSNYYAFPAENYILSHPTVTIEKGNYATSTPVKLSVISTDNMVAGRKYMVAVSITKISNGYPVIEASRTVYVALNQVIVGAALNLTSSRRIEIDFKKGASTKHDPFNLPQFSFESRVFMYAYGQFNTIMGLEENIILRTSTYNGSGGKLELAGGGMVTMTSSIAFPLNAWAHVAVTYDAATTVATMYVNGEIVASMPTSRTKKNISLKGAYEGSGWNYEYPFSLGYSAGGRLLNGTVSETRIWAKALTQAEIKNNMCAVDPQADGLLGYWKFNENSNATTFEDLTGNGFNATISNTPTWVENVKCPE